MCTSHTPSFTPNWTINVDRKDRNPVRPLEYYLLRAEFRKLVLIKKICEYPRRIPAHEKVEEKEDGENSAIRTLSDSVILNEHIYSN
jgi:hypothetical protein